MTRKRKPKTWAFKTVKRGCLICDKRLVFKSALDLKRKKYCSLKCLGVANRGRPTSALQKAITGARNRGKHLSKETRLKMSKAVSGRKATLESRLANKIAQTKRWERHFADHGRFYKELPNRGTAEYSHWRLQVHERDDFTCQQCDSAGGKLEAHHILSFTHYPELRFDVNNGVTLCKSCHSSLHYKRKAN